MVGGREATREREVGAIASMMALLMGLRTSEILRCMARDVDDRERLLWIPVIDDKVAFLGGIDLTFLDGDRWDTGKHVRDYRATDRTQRFWHDIHLRLQGPSVQMVRDNFVQRWSGATLRKLRHDGTYIRADVDGAPPSIAFVPQAEAVPVSDRRRDGG